MNASTIVRLLAEAGPPFRYNEGEDTEDGREEGTYDCAFCGPKSILTMAEIFKAHCHGKECPWRLAVEYMQGGGTDD